MIHTVDVALSQLGVQESTGHNDGIPAERYMRGDELAWCAGFILWCNEQSEDERIAKSAGEFYKMRSVQALEDEMLRRGLWFGRHIVPRRNDLILFRTRGASDAGSGRHVAIIDKVDGMFDGAGRDVETASVLVVHTVEGNLGNKVARASYDLKKQSVMDRITGFARIPSRVAA